jgi:hypothetical protein
MPGEKIVAELENTVFKNCMKFMDFKGFYTLGVVLL